MEMQQTIVSFIPESDLKAALYIILLIFAMTHTVKFGLKDFTDMTKVNRKKTLWAVSMVAGFILAFYMWPKDGVAPWWAAAWMLGPATNFLFKYGMRLLEAYFPKFAAVINFDKVKK